MGWASPSSLLVTPRFRDALKTMAITENNKDLIYALTGDQCSIVNHTCANEHLATLEIVKFAWSSFCFMAVILKIIFLREDVWKTIAPFTAPNELVHSSGIWEVSLGCCSLSRWLVPVIKKTKQPLRQTHRLVRNHVETVRSKPLYKLSLQVSFMTNRVTEFREKTKWPFNFHYLVFCIVWRHLKFKTGRS